MARPLYTALAPLRTGASVTVEGPGAVAPTPGFHPSMLPLSVANKNVADAECPAASDTMKPVWSVLNTWPVGAPVVTSTTSGALVTDLGPDPTYSVVLSVPLSETHVGDPGAELVPGDADRPQALTRSGSVNGATPGWLDTRLICRNSPWCR